MKRVAFLLALLLVSVGAYAADFADLYSEISQLYGVPDSHTGLTAFPTLLVPMGGLYEGMGTAFTAVASDSSFLDANPAASAVLNNSEMSFLHNDWIADSRLEGVVYTARFNDLGIGVGGKFLYLPFTAYDDWGEQVSKGYYSESVATLNVSYNLFSSYYFYGLALGANVKAAYRNVPVALYPGQSDLTGMIDLGALTRVNFLKFYTSHDRNFSIGAAVKNLGLYAQGDPLPTEASAGIAYSPIRPLLLSFDFNYPFSLSPALYPAEEWNVAGGMDLELTDYFSIQGGFSYRGSDPHITIGSTVTLQTITLDINYTLDMTTQLGTADRFSVAAKLNLGDGGRSTIQREVEAYYVNGLEAYAKGNYSDAIAYWEEALKLDPTFQPAQEYITTAKRAMQLENDMQNVRKIG